jgi:hypothetical protein
MTFEDQLNSLIFYHLGEHSSAQHLLKVLKKDDLARDNVGPKQGIVKRSSSEAISTRGLQQFGDLILKHYSTCPLNLSEIEDILLLH